MLAYFQVGLLVILCVMGSHSLFGKELSFQNLTLEKSEQIALSSNKERQKLITLLEKAAMHQLEMGSKWFPELQLISSGYKTEKVQEDTGTKSAFLSQISLTQALLSTDLYHDTKIAKLEKEERERLLEAFTIDLLFNVRKAYYQLVLDERNVETAKKNVDLFFDLSEKMEKNLARGTAILLQVNQSKVALANATANYYEAIKKRNIQKEHLTTLLGATPGEVEITLATDTIPLSSIPMICEKIEKLQEVYREPLPLTKKEALFSPYEIASWEERALHCRPDLHLQAKKIAIAKEEIKKERGAYFPQIQLEANYGGDPTSMSESPSSSFSNQNFNWAIGFSIQWLLFDSLGRERRVKKARLQKKADEQEYANKLLFSSEEVRKEIFSITESLAGFLAAEKSVQLAEQTLFLAVKQLEIGYITIFDYQVIVNNLIEALYIRDRTSFSVIEGYYGLKHASGIDLDEHGGS